MTSVWLQPQNGYPILPAVINSSAATVPAVAAISGNIIRVYKIFFVVGGTTNLTFEDGSTALSGPMPFVANGSLVLDMNGTPWFTTSSGNAFNILNSGAASVNGTVYYTAGQT